MQDTVEFRGSYQYPGLAHLKVAASATRAALQSRPFPANLVPAECFSCSGTTLHVHATLARHLRHAFATTILRALAETASWGSVDVRVGGALNERIYVESFARRHVLAS